MQKAIANSGMLLLSHINGQANAAKIGETVPAVRILEVFRPDLAVRVWRTHPPAGIEIPIRVYAYENSYGHSLVNYRSLFEAMTPYHIQALSDIGHEADDIIARVMQRTSTTCEQLV